MVQRSLQRIGQAALDPLLDDDPVHDDIDVVFLLLVHLDVIGQFADRPVDDDPDKPVLAQLVELFLVLPLAAADHRGQQGQLRALRQGHDLVHHLGHGLGGDLLAAGGQWGRPTRAKSRRR